MLESDSIKNYVELSMGIEQHLVALAGTRNQPERAIGAQLHVGDLDASEQAADQQTLLQTN